MLRFLSMLMLCLLVAACGRSPDEAQLRDDVEAALNSSFGDETFSIVSFARRGSASDSTAEDDDQRRVAYYDIELELMRDLVLGDWDDPAAASLVTLLGAGPRSIRGVTAGGNAAGDRIVAHASAIYRKAEDGWEFVTPAGFRDAGRPRTETGQPLRISHGALDTLAELTRSVEAGGSQAAQHVLDQELRRSVARIAGRLTRIEQGYPVAAGRDRGEYAAFAGALAELAQARQMRIVPLITAGSEENVELLRNGSVVAALVQADTAHDAYEGSGPFADRGVFTSLRALGSLYPEFVHIVVRGDAGFRTAADLQGARVALGPVNSAVRVTLTRVLAAHGLEPGRDYEVVDTRFADSLAALLRGDVDAIAHVIGVPAAPLRDALAGRGLALLPLDAESAQRLVDADKGMIAASIAPGIYPGQRERVLTVAVPALLVTTEGLTADEASKLVRLVYEAGNDLLAHGSAQGSQVSIASARRGLTIPLHTGAEQALSELDALTDEAGR